MQTKFHAQAIAGTRLFCPVGVSGIIFIIIPFIWQKTFPLFLALISGSKQNLQLTKKQTVNIGSANELLSELARNVDKIRK